MIDPATIEQWKKLWEEGDFTDTPYRNNGDFQRRVWPQLIAEVERLVGENSSLAYAYETRAMSWAEELKELRKENERLTKLVKLAGAENWTVEE